MITFPRLGLLTLAQSLSTPNSSSAGPGKGSEWSTLGVSTEYSVVGTTCSMRRCRCREGQLGLPTRSLVGFDAAINLLSNWSSSVRHLLMETPQQVNAKPIQPFTGHARYLCYSSSGTQSLRRGRRWLMQDYTSAVVHSSLVVRDSFRPPRPPHPSAAVGDEATLVH